MSGGSLNYFYCQLEDHVGDFGDKELYTGLMVVGILSTR